MKHILLSKIDRNFIRVDLWNICKEYVKENPDKFRLRYENGNFILDIKDEKKWISTLVSDSEI